MDFQKEEKNWNCFLETELILRQNLNWLLVFDMNFEFFLRNLCTYYNSN